LKKQDHCVFPAVFFTDDKYIGVRFPDLPGCNTFGESLDDALCMARDALGGHLLCIEDSNEPIPEPTPFTSIKTKPGETVVLIEVWLSVIRDDERDRAVKKTITIPNWLNLKAMEAQVNFSSVMQEALREKLGV
jgi:predicted RNase H-like HicB family nuclease